MLKYITFSTVLLISVYGASSQITKTNWMVGGSGSYAKIKTDGQQVTPSVSRTLDLSPSVGYFFANNFSAGLEIPLSFQKSSYTSAGQAGVSYDLKTILFGLGPYARYYFLSPEKRINLLIHASYHFLNKKYNSGGNMNNDKAGELFFAAGPTVFFNSSVALELTLGYSSLKYSSQGPTEKGLRGNIGFQIYLEKDD